MSIDFRENIDPVFAKIFRENEQKFSRNFRENRVLQFLLETLIRRLKEILLCYLKRVDRTGQ